MVVPGAILSGGTKALAEAEGKALEEKVLLRA